MSESKLGAVTETLRQRAERMMSMEADPSKGEWCALVREMLERGAFDDDEVSPVPTIREALVQLMKAKRPS